MDELDGTRVQTAGSIHMACPVDVWGTADAGGSTVAVGDAGTVGAVAFGALGTTFSGSGARRHPPTARIAANATIASTLSGTVGTRATVRV
jgi:hypothetical protein